MDTTNRPLIMAPLWRLCVGLQPMVTCTGGKYCSQGCSQCHNDYTIVKINRRHTYWSASRNEPPPLSRLSRRLCRRSLFACAAAGRTFCSPVSFTQVRSSMRSESASLLGNGRGVGWRSVAKSSAVPITEGILAEGDTGSAMAVLHLACSGKISGGVEWWSVMRG